MKFKNVELIKVGEEYKDTKDRIFFEVVLPGKVPVLENNSSVNIHDFGTADNFRIVKDIVLCDVELYDKYKVKIQNVLNENYQLHVFVKGNVKRQDLTNFKLVKMCTWNGLFFNKMKVFNDFKDFKDCKVKG